MRSCKRNDKGTRIEFDTTTITKHFDSEPRIKYKGCWIDYQRGRMLNELRVYTYARETGCPYIPEMVYYDIDNSNITIQRVHGTSVFDLIMQDKFDTQAYSKALAGIYAFQSWCERNQMPHLGTNSKDIIITEEDQVKFIDFEDADWNNPHVGVIYSLIEDLLQRRIGLRPWRSTTYSDKFALELFKHKPYWTLRCLPYWLAHKIINPLRRMKP